MNIKIQVMDLQARKYSFIEQLINIDNESIMETLERTLKKEKEESQELTASTKKELDKRLESYKNNPDDLLDWENVKNDW